jgi:signal transduction histidine kinase/DNA-binding NarL/FixJ family response regulator
LSTPINVLIVDDSPSDTQLVLHELKRSGFAPTFERVDSQAATAAALDRGGWHVVIADYHLPGWSGLSALKMVREREMTTPFIVVSGTIGEETAVEAMRAGAHDYVLKDNLARLGPAVTREMADAQVRRERHQALATLSDMARKSTFLAEASRRLGGSLNYDETLEEAARVAIPELCQWCVITVAGDGPERLRAIVAHVDPALQALAREHVARFPPDRRIEGGATRAIKSAARVSTTPESALCTTAGRDEDVRLVSVLGHRDGLSVPLVAHGRTAGAMTLVRTEKDFSPEEAGFAVELAQRAATALDNALLYRQAREAVKARDEFLLVASHELNTPLATLTLRLNELPDSALGGAPPVAPVPAPEKKPGLTNSLPAARRQVQNLARLVGNLLDVSRITAQRLVLSITEMDLVAAFRDVIEQLGPELQRAKCEVRLVAPETLVGRWDALRISQIATNLISNALKYGAGKPIDVILEQIGEGPDVVARMTVCDRGIGISSEDIGRIFELFERSGAAKDFGGLGLGLYITRQVVEAHGGSIRVTSKPDAGAVFVVDLPLRAQRDDAHRRPERAASAPKAAG